MYARVHSSTISKVKGWKQPKCPSMDEWINKMWSTHTMEYYSSIKRQEILTPTTMWMNLADMMLSEISQSQKDKYSDCVHVRDLKQSDSQRQTVDGACVYACG